MAWRDSPVSRGCDASTIDSYEKSKQTEIHAWLWIESAVRVA